MSATSPLDVVRRVPPPGEVEENTNKPGRVTDVRRRSPRWTGAQPRVDGGYYCARLKGDRRQRSVIQVWLQDLKTAAFPDVEWSDRPIQWPLEQTEEEDDELKTWRRGPAVGLPPTIVYQQVEWSLYGHGVWYWASLAFMVGIVLGILIMVGATYTLMHH